MKNTGKAVGVKDATHEKAQLQQFAHIYTHQSLCSTVCSLLQPLFPLPFMNKRVTSLKPHFNNSKNYTVRIHGFFQPMHNFFSLRSKSRNDIAPSPLNLKHEPFTSFLRFHKYIQHSVTFLFSQRVSIA